MHSLMPVPLTARHAWSMPHCLHLVCLSTTRDRLLGDLAAVKAEADELRSTIRELQQQLRYTTSFECTQSVEVVAITMVWCTHCFRDAEMATERVTSERDTLKSQVATITSKLEEVEQERERQAKPLVLYMYLHWGRGG